MAENPQERLIRYIQDAHAEEVGSVQVINDFINEIDDVQVKSLLQEHVAVTESQARRLEARLTTLGSGASTGKGLINKILGKASDLVQGAHDLADKTTQALIKSYATEHLEVAMYESLKAYAEAVGDSETAQLAAQIQSEEKASAEKLFPLISPEAKSALNATVAA